MAIRKMPLVEYQYLNDDLELGEDPAKMDDAASTLLEQMRSVVKTDRELVDRVGCLASGE